MNKLTQYCFITALLVFMTASVVAKNKPNILVLWGDDIGKHQHQC